MRFTWQRCWCLFNQEPLSRSYVACIYTHYCRIKGCLGASDKLVVDWCMNWMGCLWWTELAATLSFRSLSECLFCYLRQRDQLWTRESSRKLIRGGGMMPLPSAVSVTGVVVWVGVREQIILNGNLIGSPPCLLTRVCAPGTTTGTKTWALPRCALMKVSL